MTFDSRLDEIVGEAGDKTLIRYAFVPCWHYAFAEDPLYLWAGKGRLFTEDDQEWLGTIDQAGRNHHETPKLSDSRDGASVQVKFKWPYLDRETYLKFRDDHDAVNGVVVTAYLALFEDGEGLRPQTPIRFFSQYTLQSATFKEGRADGNRSGVRTYIITGLAKNGNVGRSQMAGGTMTDPCQQQRAAYWGEDPDYGAGFVAELANASRQFP